MDISNRKFARAVNRCAWWLTKELGEHTEPKSVLYLGPLDLRYLIIILAAAKAGHIVSLGRKIEVPLSDPDHPRSGIFQLSPQQPRGPFVPSREIWMRDSSASSAVTCYYQADLGEKTHGNGPNARS